MDFRFVLSWVALSIATQGALQWWFVSRPNSPVFLQQEFVLVLSYLDVPLAQGLALRLARIPWARQWFVATLAGSLAGPAIAGALMSVLSAARVNIGWFQVWTIVPGLLVAGLQWYVLRGRVRRPGLWWIAAAAAMATTLAIRLGVTGVPRAGAPPLDWMTRLFVFVAPSVVLGVGLAWLLRERREASPALREKPAWFVIEWTTATALAVMLIVTCGQLIAAAPRRTSGAADLSQFVLIPTVVGLVIGASQWWVLRSRVPIGLSWIAASALAMAVPAALSVLPQMLPATGYLWFYLIVVPPAFAAVGLWLGAVQWFFLRRHVRRAWLWVPASGIAWCAWYLRYLSYRVDLIPVGVAAGLVTGAAMAFLLRNPRTDDAEPLV
jgi:hypothetical protein